MCVYIYISIITVTYAALYVPPPRLCLLWLWRHFPASVKENVGSGALAEHTCLKGLLDLLMYAARLGRISWG